MTGARAGFYEIRGDRRSNRKPLRTCLDCPAQITAGRKRCAPCAANHYDELQRVRKQKAKAVTTSAEAP